MFKTSSVEKARPLDLALAMVAASSTPLLLLDGDLLVVAASASFCRAYGLDPGTVIGVAFNALGGGEWGLRTLGALLASTAAGVDFEDYEFDLRRPGKPALCLAVNAHRLDYDRTAVRLLVTVIDITEVRASQLKRTELLNEKAVLLQELQHRVANSLQIIASVLMQSARRVSSDETRHHLRDAHNRVMSIAAVQQQLAASGEGKVALKPYFERLGASLGASMIGDAEKLCIEVTCDASEVEANVSVSMGLVVTELVINALKHGFPDGRSGTIFVDYRAGERGWTLLVTDDGVGMPTGANTGKAGLGTSIVTALARQLSATVSVEAAHPGTRVALVHHDLAADNDAAAPPVVAV